MSRLTAALLSMAALGGRDGFGSRAVADVPVGWRPGEKRGPAPDLREELRKIFSSQCFAWKHRFTGQVRVFDWLLPTDTDVRCIQFDRRGRMLAHPDGSGKVLRRSFSDALAWLRNAEEVQA